MSMDDAGKLWMMGLLLFLLAYLAFRYPVMKYLEDHFYDEWNQMGRPPRLFGSNESSASERRFFQSKAYLLWFDPKFAKLCTRYSRFMTFSVVFVISWMVLAVFLAYGSRNEQRRQPLSTGLIWRGNGSSGPFADRSSALKALRKT